LYRVGQDNFLIVEGMAGQLFVFFVEAMVVPRMIRMDSFKRALLKVYFLT